MRKSVRRQTPSERAINSECDIVKNIINPNSPPELSGDKNTECKEETNENSMVQKSKEETNENSMVQPSQTQQSQIISLTQNSQSEGSQLISLTPDNKNDKEEVTICSECSMIFIFIFQY